MKVLLTKDHTNELKISIDNDTENVKEVLRDIESIQDPQYLNPLYQYSPKYQSLKKDEYTSGKAGIGPFALNNAHHVLTQLVDMKMASNAFTEQLRLTNLGKIYDDAGVNRSGNRTRVLSWLSALINAFVDIAKDPYIVRLNVNAYTYNIAAYLTRMGKGEATYYFLNQPIMKDIAQAVLKTRGKYGVDQHVSQSQREKAAIEEVLKKYGHNTHAEGFKNLVTDEQKAVMFSQLLDTTQLRNLMLQDKNDENFDYSQIYIYYGFLELNKYAEAMSDLVKYSKIDTKKMGKTFAEQHIYNNGIDELMSDSRFAAGEVRRFFDETFLQVKRQNSIDFGAALFQGQLIRNTQAFIEMQDMILDKINRKSSATEKILKPIIRSMEAAIKSEFFNQLMTKEGLTAKDLLYGNRSMASRLLNLKQAILSGKVNGYLNPDGTFNNYLLDYLMTNIGKTETLYQKPDFINTFSMFDTDTVGQNSLIDSWQELYDDARTNKFAKDLAIYAFLTTGDNPTMNNFFKYLSNKVKKEFGYDKFISDTLLNFNSGSSVNINWKDIFLNNWQNNDLVKPLEYETVYLEEGKDPATGEDGFVTNRYKFINIPSKFPAINGKRPVMDAFVGVRNKNRDNIKPIGYFQYIQNDGLSLREVSAPKYPPFVKIKYSNDNAPHNTLVYELIGVMEQTNVGKKPNFVPVYKIVNKKGYKMQGNVITEYGRTDGYSFNNFPPTVDNEAALTVLSNRIKDVKNIYTAEEYYRLSEIKYVDILGDYVEDDGSYYDEELEEWVKPKPNASEFTLHSGGATGSDSFWDDVAKEFGIGEAKHYMHPAQVGKWNQPPRGNAVISDIDITEGATEAARAVHRIYGATFRQVKQENLIRDWAQTKYADTIFAVGKLMPKGSKFDTKTDRILTNDSVIGGTAYATNMGILHNKQVFVFNQEKNDKFDIGWYKYDYMYNEYESVGTPVLTKNFAGIGTREINDVGKQAIRDVFEKTFNTSQVADEQKRQEGKNIKDQCKGE